MSLQSLLKCPIVFTFLVIGLLINLVQAVLYIPVTKTLFRKLNYYLVYGLQGYLLSLGDWCSNNVVNVYCSKDMQEMIKKKEVEHALCLMNHHTELDWLYAWMLGDRLGILGNCRAFVKDSLKYVPILGWSWAMSDMIFLKREWEKDQETMIEKINILVDYPSPMWLLLFPEGTRFTAEKHQACLRFAGQSKLPLLLHHLTPRTKGFSFIVDNVDREKLKAVYDVTLVVGEGSAPFNVNSIINGRSTIGNILVRRIPIDTIPKDKVESAAWLHNLYKEKDDFKHNFLTTGNFYQDCTFVTPPRRMASLVLLVITNLMVLIPMLYCVVICGWMMRAVVFLLGGISMVAMKMIEDSTKIDKSSTYGNNNKNQ